MGQKEWSRAVAEHGRFLEGGGAGGTWELKVTAGIPSTTYCPADVTQAVFGQAVFCMENLKGVKAVGVNLSFADFTGSRGEEVKFSRSDLTSSRFLRGQFDHAVFSGANLTQADFSGCRLVGADFRKADLTGTNFENADLTGANFAGAITAGTKFGGAVVKAIRY